MIKQTISFPVDLGQPGISPRQPIRLEGREREEWESFIEFLSRQPGERRPSDLPRFKPAIRDLLADDAGRIWVQVYTSAVKRSIPPRPADDPRPLLTVRELNTFDLFDDRARYLGRLELPLHTILLAIAGDRIWVRTEMARGEQVLIRYRLQGSRGRGG